MSWRTPGWWYRERAPIATMLAPLAALYGRVARRRAGNGAPYVSRLTVICIGNFTAGGGGKTPTAIAVAELLTLAGEKPVFLTRGYGGKAKGPVRVTEGMDADEVGDEALLLAAHAPTIVSADRAKGAAVIETMDASVIVMDDGFQNNSLAKDVALITVDARSGIGNGRVMPAGPLRAPLEAQLPAADALVVIGEGSKATALCHAFQDAGKLVLKARIEPTQDTRWLSVLPAIAFAGIARPEKFFATLREAGGRIEETRSFPDHHRYSDREARKLLDEAKEKKCMLVTTEKDWVRLPDDEERPAGELKHRSRPLTIALKIGDEAALGDLLMAAIRSKRGE